MTRPTYTQLEGDGAICVVVEEGRVWSSVLTEQRPEIHWYSVPPSELKGGSDVAAAKSLLMSASRIILVAPAAWATLSLHPELRQILVALQERTKVLLTTWSLPRLDVSVEIPTWELARQAQQQRVVELSALFPQIDFVCLNDCFEVADSPAVSLMLVWQNLYKGVLLVPNGGWAPCLIGTTLPQLVDELFRPKGSSVVVQGGGVGFAATTNEARGLYGALHQTSVETQLVECHNQPILPFPHRVVGVKQELGELFRALVALLPAPTSSAVLTNQALQLKKQLQHQKQYVEDQSHTTTAEAPRLSLLSTVELRSLDGDDASNADGVVMPVVMTVDSIAPINSEAILSSEVAQLFLHSDATRDAQRLVTKTTNRVVVGKKSRKRGVVFLMGLSFIAVGVAALALLGSLQLSTHMANRALLSWTQAVSAGGGAESMGTDNQKITRWRQLLSTQLWLAAPLFSLPVIESAGHTNTLLNTVPSWTQLKIGHRVALSDLFAATFAASASTTTSNPIVKIEQLRLASDQLASSTAQLRSDPALKSADDLLQQQLFYAPLFGVDGLQRSSVVSGYVFPQLANLLAAKGTKVYAVALQNSQELRPTGGFLEAVALLTFSDGKLVGKSVFSSYSLDSRLAGQVQPPDDLKSTLKEPQWWLRDSNWEPGSEISARQLMWFLGKAGVTKVDGVVGVSTSSLSQLLSAVGEMNLAEFNEVLTAQNIEERLEFHSGLRTKSTGPDYYETLLLALINKITSARGERLDKTLALLAHTFDQQQWWVYFSEAPVQQAALALGWSPSHQPPNCPPQVETNNCVVDGLQVVESNVGVNRVNPYIKRGWQHSTALSAGLVVHKRTITLNNSSPSTVWPKGSYTAYMRLYTNQAPMLVEVSVGGIPLMPTDIIQRSADGRWVVGFMMLVQPGQTVSAEVTYQIPLPLSAASSYLFYEQRQPGLLDSLPALFIEYPKDWQPVTIAPKAVVGDSTLLFSAEDGPLAAHLVSFAPTE